MKQFRTFCYYLLVLVTFDLAWPMPNSALSMGETLSNSSDKLHKLARHYSTIDAWAILNSSDYLQFYDRKLHYLDDHYNKILDLAQEYKRIANEGVKNEEVVQYLSKRISTLEDNLNEVQLCLYDERENYVKLVGENEQLKLENEDYRRKFQAVLFMSKIDERDVSLFMKKNAKAAELTDKMVEIKEEIIKCKGPKKSQYEFSNIVVKKQVQVLENHIKELTASHLDKEYALKEHLKLLLEEKETQRDEYENRLKNCVDNVRESKDLVHKLVLENVQTGQKFLAAEQDWAKERDKLLKLLTQTDLETLEPFSSTSNCLLRRRVSDDSESARRLKEKIARLEGQVMEKENLVDEYKIKFIRMEKQMFRLRELESEVRKVHKNDVRKLTERNKIIEKRCEEMDTRRKLDNAGFREDIVGVKQLLTAIERKFRLTQLKKKNSISSPTESIGGTKSGKIEQVRIISAPGNVPSTANEEVDSEKDTLTWEMLNHLLRIAAERTCQLEKRVKLGCPNADV